MEQLGQAPKLTRSASFSAPSRSEGLGRAEGSMPRANTTENMTVTPLSLPTPARQEIGTAFGIRDRDLRDNAFTEKGPLSAGQELLNKDFSKWKMSSDAASKSFDWDVNMVSSALKSIGCFFKSIHTYLWSGDKLVTEAKANQELLKNPVIATEAIAYLAGLRTKGVTVDLTRYRDHKLEQEKNEEGEVIKGPKGTELAVGIANAKEEAHLEAALATEARLPEKYRQKLEGSADIFATRQVAITDLQDAMNAISELAPSFDAQRQMVAAVTHNIALQAGIITEEGKINNPEGMNFLVDQMSSLWIQSAPVGDKATPFAVTQFADKTAQSFDASKPDSFGAIYIDVQNHAQIFAEALITEKPTEEEDFAAYEQTVNDTAAKFETQIWDSLKANATFTGKMTEAVKGITTEHTRLHEYTLTTDVIAKTVVDSFQDISASNRGNQSGEEFFNMQLASLGTRMPNEMFSILKGFTSEEVTEGKHEMSLARLHAIDPTLGRVGGPMSVTDLLTEMEIDKSASDNAIKSQEVGGDIYTVLAGYGITTDENGANITGIFNNKQFTPETLAATLTRADWHCTQVKRFVENFNEESGTVKAYEESLAFTSPESLKAALVKGGKSAEQAQVIVANFDVDTQMVDTSAVMASATGRAALPKEMVPTNPLLAEIVRDHTNGNPAQVDVFKVFTDPKLLDNRAVVAEMQSGEGSSRPEAQTALFNRWVGYSTAGIMGQYENALDFMRVEGAPSKRSLDLYDAPGKQKEINALQNHLTALTDLATQGTVSRELQDVRNSDVATAMEVQTVALKDPYAKGLGLIATRDIETGALEGRFNLQDKDYYSMLSKALGLKEGGTTGSATLTRELLTHLGELDLEEEEDKNTSAAYLLITQGKITWDEYVDLYQSSPEVEAADTKVMEMLEGITSDKHGMDTVSMRLSGLEEGVTLARFSDQIDDLRAFIENEAQPALTKHQDEIQLPVYMIENGKVDALAATVAKHGVEGVAIQIMQKIAPALEGVERANLKLNIEGALADLAVPERKDAAAKYLKENIVEASRLPKVAVDNPLLDVILGEVEDEFLDAVEEQVVGIDAEALIARLGEGQVTVSRDLAAKALGKEVGDLAGPDIQLAADISTQLTLLQLEDSKDAARIELNRLLNRG